MPLNYVLLGWVGFLVLIAIISEFRKQGQEEAGYSLLGERKSTDEFLDEQDSFDT